MVQGYTLSLNINVSKCTLYNVQYKSTLNSKFKILNAILIPDLILLMININKVLIKCQSDVKLFDMDISFFKNSHDSMKHNSSEVKSFSF